MANPFDRFDVADNNPFDRFDEPTSSYPGDKARRLGREIPKAIGQVISSPGTAVQSAAQLAADAAGWVAKRRGDLTDEELTRARAALESALEQRPEMQAAQAIRDVGQQIGDVGKRFVPDPARDREIGSVVATGLSSLAPALAAAPFGMIGPVAATAGMMGESQREDAAQAGATPSQQAAAFALGAPVGAASEAMLGVPAMLRGLRGANTLPKALQGAEQGADALIQKAIGELAPRIVPVAQQALKNAVREGIQEGIEQITGNTIAKDVVGYDKERDRTEGLGTAMLAGGIVGGGLGGTLAALDTGKNIPESAATLKAQQEQLIAGKRPAQMFPTGTKELALPQGFERVETERGVFHYDPKQLTADDILTKSKNGRENELLNLGPASKADVDQRVAKGESRVAVTERAADGTEIRTAVATDATADAVAKEFEKNKSAGSKIAVEPLDRVPAERRAAQGGGFLGDIIAKDAADIAARRATEAKELADRAERQKDLDDKKARFADRIQMARDVYRNPAATFAEINGAIKGIELYANDNSIGLTVDQRTEAQRALPALERRLEALRPAEEARRDEEARAREILEKEQAEKTKRALQEQKAKFEAEANAGIGASGAFDYRTAPMAALEAKAEQGDDKAVEWISRRMAEEEEAQNRGDDLLKVLRRVKLPATDAALGTELQLLKMESMTAQQRMNLIDSKAEGLDPVAEALREAGFTSIQTPADVLDAVGRALAGEKIYPETGGDVSVEFARGGQQQDGPPEGFEVVWVTESKLLSLLGEKKETTGAWVVLPNGVRTARQLIDSGLQASVIDRDPNTRASDLRDFASRQLADMKPTTLREASRLVSRIVPRAQSADTPPATPTPAAPQSDGFEIVWSDDRDLLVLLGMPRRTPGAWMLLPTGVRTYEQLKEAGIDEAVVLTERQDTTAETLTTMAAQAVMDMRGTTSSKARQLLRIVPYDPAKGIAAASANQQPAEPGPVRPFSEFPQAGRLVQMYREATGGGMTSNEAYEALQAYVAADNRSATAQRIAFRVPELRNLLGEAWRFVRADGNQTPAAAQPRRTPEEYSEFYWLTTRYQQYHADYGAGRSISRETAEEVLRKFPSVSRETAAKHVQGVRQRDTVLADYLGRFWSFINTGNGNDWNSSRVAPAQPRPAATPATPTAPAAPQTPPAEPQPKLQDFPGYDRLLGDFLYFANNVQWRPMSRAQAAAEIERYATGTQAEADAIVANITERPIIGALRRLRGFAIRRSIQPTLPGMRAPAPAQPQLTPEIRDRRTRLAKVFRALADVKDELSWQFKRTKTKSKDLAEVAKEFSAGRITLKVTPDEDGERWTIETKENGQPLGEYSVFTNPAVAGRKQLVNVSATEADSDKQEEGGGKNVYQAIFTWAHNNGYRVLGNHLSLKNQFRRTVNMLSSALRFNSTDHLEPYHSQGIGSWIEGNTDNNIGAMLEALSSRVAIMAPKVSSLTYDIKTDTVVDQNDGRKFTPAELRDFVRETGLVEQGIGPATLRVVLLARAEMAANARGQRLPAARALRAASEGVLGRVLYARGNRPADGSARRGAGSRPDQAAPRDLRAGTAPELTDQQVEKEVAAIRKAFPKLVEENDVQLANVQRALAQRAKDLDVDIGYVPPEVQAAVMRVKGQRTLIVLGARAYRDRAKGAALLTHEMAHPFWDMLPWQTKDALRDLHRAEKDTRSGPLYRDGKLQTELAYVEDMDENGHKEWFAERIARLNESWAKEKMDASDSTLLRRLAYQLREYLRRIWRAFAANEGVDPDGKLFVDDFRAFFASGGNLALARQAGADFAQSMMALDTPLGIRLPSEIRNLQPRWNDKILRFESALDKALYYAGGENTVTRGIVRDALAQQTGLKYGQIATAARELRDKLAPLARSAARDGTIRVPSQMQQEVAAMTGTEFASGKKPKLDPAAAEREYAAAFDNILENYYQQARDSVAKNPPRTSAEDVAKERGQVLTPEQAAAKLEEWKAEARKQGRTGKNSGKTILSLFDSTGVWSQPWRDAGYNVVQVDQNIVGGDGYEMDVLKIDQEWLMDNGLDMVHGVLAACPCTEFAGSGARWFAIKDADGRTEKAKQLVEHTLAVIEYLQPDGFWALENPIGRIKEVTEIPLERLQFQPHNYGDPYTKRTQIFGMFNADLPQANVAPTGGSYSWNLSGSSESSKAERSKTFEGFAYSFFMANKDRDAWAEADELARQNVEARQRADDAPATTSAQSDPDGQFGLEFATGGGIPELPQYPRGAEAIAREIPRAKRQADEWRDIMPSFQGWKRDMATYAADAIRKKLTEEQREKITEIHDWFGGGGSWGLHLALTHFPKATKLTVHEFLPARLAKIRRFHTEGAGIKASIDAITPQIETARDEMYRDGKPSPAAFVTRLKKQFPQEPDEATAAILQAIEDRADNDFASSTDEEGNRDARKSIEDLLRAVVDDAAAAQRGAFMFTTGRGGTIEYQTGDSYAGAVEPSETTLSVFDPPYYKTAGYSAADSNAGKVPISIYEKTGRRLNELARAGHAVVYTDSAWWIDERRAAEAAAKQKTDQPGLAIGDVASVKPDERGTAFANYILASLDHAAIVPIKTRHEVLAVHAPGSTTRAGAAEEPRRFGGDAGGVQQRPADGQGAGAAEQAELPAATAQAAAAGGPDLAVPAGAGTESAQVGGGNPRQRLEAEYAAARDQFDLLTEEAEKIQADIEGLRESQEADAETQLRARYSELRDNEAALRRAYARASELRSQLDATKPTKVALPEGATADDIIAQAARVEALPKTDRKGALIAEWRYGKKLREEGIRVGNDTAESEGQQIMNKAKARLDDEYPGWEKEAYAKPANRRPPPPPPPPDPETAQEADLEPSPFAEPPKDMPVRSGKMLELFGNSSVKPTILERTWERVADVFRGIRGSVPELPAFAGARWNQSDPFIKEHGPSFYDGIKSFYRTLVSANDGIQRDAEQQVAEITRPLIEAGGRFNASDYAKLRRYQEAARAARAENRPVPAATQIAIEALNAKLESHPYVMFNRIVLLLDLKWRHENLKDSQGNPIRLPAGVNEEEIKAELERLQLAAVAQGHRDLILAAVTKHIALVKKVADDLSARDLMTPQAVRNTFYFPHVTLQVTRGGQTEERELRPSRVRPGTEADFRGYLEDPVGSTKPIETDYVAAMYYHLVQVGAHNTKADAVRDFARPYDVRGEVEKRAKELAAERGQSVSWEQTFHEEYAPRGYVLYGTESRDAFPSINVDRDKLARRLGVMLTSDDLQQQLKQLGVPVTLLPEDLRETLQQGQRETWVVPARVAEALRGIADRQSQHDGAIDTAVKGTLRAWKSWKLFMPWNHVRYEWNNAVADIEKVVSASPATLRHLPQAAREIRSLWLGEAPGADLQQAVRLGVINTVTAQEMSALTRLPNFRAFESWSEKLQAETTSILSAPIANATRLFGGTGVLGRVSSVEESAYREAVFRYAKFIGDLKAIRANARPAYAGAYWRDIEAIKDSRPGAADAAVRKAAAISKATFGDYGDLSVLGQSVRDRLVPFYSWLEINFRYHANLLRNMRDMVRAGEASRAEAAGTGARAAAVFAAGFTARAAGGIALRLALPYAAVILWNSTGDRDELEELLSDEDKRRFHIIVGESSDGNTTLRDGRKVEVIYAATALMDVLKWFSGPQLAQAAGSWLNGRQTFPQAFTTWRDGVANDLANNLAQSVGPAFKIPYTLASGKNPFPDVADQRTIPSYDMRRTILGQMTDEATADVIERTANKDYYAAKDLGDWAKQLILQVRQRDPDSWAFYEIKDRAQDFLQERTGRKRSSDYDAPDQQVLRNFRRAIFRGDVEKAAQFYLRLLDYGYTAERFAASIRAQDPLAQLPKEDGTRRAFVDSLNPTDREILQRAYAYYTRINASQGREARLFPRAETGERGLERYRLAPRTAELGRMMEAGAAATEEDELARAERALRKSLQKQ
ncbi:MAG: hypothetical protein B9S38_02505 [Verrucomicrobiia bacterium Tous-C4TDCM]|nr:MAG: hypothetical protein B9S38_02505 [Verrucomicrobiae bacterium Tous-C4TDCM]